MALDIEAINACLVENCDTRKGNEAITWKFRRLDSVSRSLLALVPRLLTCRHICLVRLASLLIMSMENIVFENSRQKLDRAGR